MAMYEKEGSTLQNEGSFLLTEEDCHHIIHNLAKEEKNLFLAFHIENCIRRVILNSYWIAGEKKKRKIVITQVENLYQIPGLVLYVRDGECKISDDCLNLYAEDVGSHIIGVNDEGDKIQVYLFRKE